MAGNSFLFSLVSEFVTIPRWPSGGVPPVSIPNTEVKPSSADGTAPFTGGRVGRRQAFFLFCCGPCSFSSYGLDALGAISNSKGCHAYVNSPRDGEARSILDQGSLPRMWYLELMELLLGLCTRSWLGLAFFRHRVYKESGSGRPDKFI